MLATARRGLRLGQRWWRPGWARLLSRLIPLALFSIVFVFLGYAVYRDWGTLARYTWQVNPVYLLMTTLVHSCTLAMTAWSWHLIMRRLNPGTGLAQNLRIYYATVLAKRVPGPIWFAAGRVHLYRQAGVPSSSTLTGIVLETTLMFVAGLAVCLGLSPSYPYVYRIFAENGIWFAMALVPMLIVVVRPAWLSRAVDWLVIRLGGTSTGVRIGYRDILAWLLLYAFEWLVGGLALFGVINAVHPIPLAQLPSVVAVATLVGLVGLLNLVLPALPGLKEVAMALLLTSYVPLSVGVVITLLYRVWLTLDEVLWMALTARWRARG